MSNIPFLVLWLVPATLAYVAQIVALKAAQKPENRARLWESWKHKYSFNELTGEWSKILRKSPTGGFIVNNTPRDKRILKEDTLLQSSHKAGLFVFYAGFLFLTVYLKISGHYTDGFSRVFADMFGIAALFILAIGTVPIVAYVSGWAILVIDPPAVPPNLDVHGPAVGGMPDTGEAVPVGTYEPKR